MENTSQSKRSKRKLLYLVILVMTTLSITGVALLYFLPIPKELDKVVSSGAKVKRCIYSGGIGYQATSQLESFRGSIFSTIIYNNRGEQECSSGGYTGKALEEKCQIKVCTGVYEK